MIFDMRKLFLSAAFIVMSGFVGYPALAAEQTIVMNQNPGRLFDNLHAPAANWSVPDESRYVDSLMKPLSADGANSMMAQFVTPNGHHYFFGIVRTDHPVNVIYFANKRSFQTLDQFKAFIHDTSDWELIGTSLGIYAGPISVSLPSQPHAQKHGK